MLNTPVFHGMMTTKASEKSIKITALDEEGDVKVYLIQVSIIGFLTWRVWVYVNHEAKFIFVTSPSSVLHRMRKHYILRWSGEFGPWHLPPLPRKR
jgi:hypothetical protein